MAKLYINDEILDLQPGKTLFDHADQTESAYKHISSSCGRVGTCRECLIEIKQGMEALSPYTERESFLKPMSSDSNPQYFRLACQAKVAWNNVDIHCQTFKGSLQIVQQGNIAEVELNPLTHRKGDDVYWGQELIDSYEGHLYGLAIDLGTTTVVINLVDLETGETIAVSSFENPQKYGGSDVLHRISYDHQSDHQGRLHDTIISFLNQEIRKFPVNRRQIYEVVLAGNATMRDIFFGLDVETIGVSPYKSLTQYDFEDGVVSSTSLLRTAKDLRLFIHPQGKVYGLPLIGCHVGADTAAVALTLGIDKSDKPLMMIDIGTNTEVILGNKDRIIAASCPAGPAFEGGKITYGMSGVEGAIEKVSIKDGQVHYHVIGEGKPYGLCGSGLIDLLAELKSNALMDELGRFHDGSNYFTVAKDRGITFSRADISELAQAKSANIAGQKILLRRYGLHLSDIHTFYLAGGFAWYIDPEHAIEIGLIPPFPLDRIVKIGNAALEGARQVLLNQNKRQEVEDLVRKIEHIELEQEEDFFDLFVDGAQFKPLDIK